MRCQDKKAVRVCHSFGMDDSRSECPDMDMPTAEQCRCSKKKNNLLTLTYADDINYPSNRRVPRLFQSAAIVMWPAAVCVIGISSTSPVRIRKLFDCHQAAPCSQCKSMFLIRIYVNSWTDQLYHRGIKTHPPPPTHPRTHPHPPPP